MFEADRLGTVVLLNGASSAGKTTVARALLRQLPDPWFLLSVDDVNAMRSREPSAALSGEHLSDVLRRTRAGFHRCVRGLADAGNDVVADHVLSEPWRLHDIVGLWADLDVVLVGVHCDADELLRRERARGDRVPGAAADQRPVVHRGVVYDVEVDTTVTSPDACAQAIARAVLDGRRGGWAATSARGGAPLSAHRPVAGASGEGAAQWPP